MCKSDNEPQKADLPIDFNNIEFKVNDKDVIICNENGWIYKFNNNEIIGRSIKSQLSEDDSNQDNIDNNNSKINSLNDEINEKNNRIKDLKAKIQEIDNKIQTMNKILNIDVSEQEYVKELELKINNEKPQD